MPIKIDKTVTLGNIGTWIGILVAAIVTVTGTSFKIENHDTSLDDHRKKMEVLQKEVNDVKTEVVNLQADYKLIIQLLQSQQDILSRVEKSMNENSIRIEQRVNENARDIRELYKEKNKR